MCFLTALPASPLQRGPSRHLSLTEKEKQVRAGGMTCGRSSGVRTHSGRRVLCLRDELELKVPKSWLHLGPVPSVAGGAVGSRVPQEAHCLCRRVRPFSGTGCTFSESVARVAFSRYRGGGITRGLRDHSALPTKSTPAALRSHGLIDLLNSFPQAL